MTQQDPAVQHDRHAVAGAVSVGLAVALVALVGPAILIGLSAFLIVLGVVFCVTVIGVVIGVPLIVVGALGVVGGAIGGSGGPLFALVLGAVSGLVYYEHRTRHVA